MRRLTVSFLVLLFAAAQANAQFIACNDQTTPARQIWHVNASDGSKTLLYQGGTEANCWGMAYDPNNNTLYWNNGGSLYKATYSIAGITPSLIGTLNIGGSTTNVTGLAFDASSNKLIGYRSISSAAGPIGFYEITPATAAMTLVSATPASTDFGGLDYDVATGAFYGLNDGTGLSGRGLYKIGNMYGGPTYTQLTAYPGTDTDVDGLATGGGRAFMINDTNAQPYYVFDLTSNAYLPNLPNAFTGTNGIFSGGAWVPEPATIGLMLIGIAAFRRRK